MRKHSLEIEMYHKVGGTTVEVQVGVKRKPLLETDFLLEKNRLLKAYGIKERGPALRRLQAYVQAKKKEVDCTVME